MPEVLVFDLNGTLLDVGTLGPKFAAAFGKAEARQVWFDQLLQLALASTVTGEYQEFGALAGAALEMLAVHRQVTLTPEAKGDILQGMRRLPAFPDVAPGLERLKAAGVRLAVLTNSTAVVAQEQVEAAGLTPYFESVLSADAVRRLKPAPEPYRMAAERLGVRTAQVCLVAAHAWDLAGARAAGCTTAFVARPNQALDPLAPAPYFVGSDVQEVAERVLAARG